MTDISNVSEGTMNAPLNITKEIIEKFGDRVKLSDSNDDNIELYCYTHCDSTDSDMLKRCRGVIFDGDTLVLNSFPYTEELTAPCKEKQNEPDYIPDFKDIIDSLGDLNQYSFYESHEGCVIRLFNHKGVWYTSTHRKLNADKSKWASKQSFGEIFRDALSYENKTNQNFNSRISAGMQDIENGEDILCRFQNTLDTDKQYMFLICNNDGNRIVCNAPEKPTVYHVGTFINGTLHMDISVDIPYPKLYTIRDVNDLGDAVYDIDPFESQGIIAFGPNNRQIKIYNPQYSLFYSARGNEPSVKFRYLQVRMDHNLTDMLYYLYPNNVKDFDDYENNLFQVAKNITKAYVFRYIKKKHVKMPREEYSVMKESHTWHLSNREQNKVNIEKIISIMNQRPPTSLNKMLKNLKDKSGEPVISEPKPSFHNQLLAKNKESHENLDNMMKDKNDDTPTIIELGIDGMDLKEDDIDMV
jgi:hypothetical protein